MTVLCNGLSGVQHKVLPHLRLYGIVQDSTIGLDGKVGRGRFALLHEERMEAA